MQIIRFEDIGKMVFMTTLSNHKEVDSNIFNIIQRFKILNNLFWMYQIVLPLNTINSILISKFDETHNLKSVNVGVILLSENFWAFLLFDSLR